MTKLSEFNNELISCTLSQQEYKLLIVGLGMILELSDAIKHPELTTTIGETVKDAFKASGFKVDDRLIHSTAIVVDLLYSKLMDSYTEKRWVFVERANQELHMYAEENFHPDIYNLPEGEILQVAEL